MIWIFLYFLVGFLYVTIMAKFTNKEMDNGFGYIMLFWPLIALMDFLEYWVEFLRK